uniref:Uncharacterized protein n=1 Tax=Romanomermis culicivorax TaxID=13658 RepID=A0A915KVT5_ROMCU
MAIPAGAIYHGTCVCALDYQPTAIHHFGTQRSENFLGALRERYYDPLTVNIPTADLWQTLFVVMQLDVQIHGLWSDHFTTALFSVVVFDITVSR